MIDNIEFSINHQLVRLRERYKAEIKAIADLRGTTGEFYQLLLDLSEAGRHLKGTNLLLPFYYILTHDFQMAWILLNYQNIAFAYMDKNYHPHAKQDLEAPVIWDMKPLWRRDNEDRIMSARYGSTCFRLTADYIPQALEDIKSGVPNREPYDITPEARYRTVNRIKNFHLSYSSFFQVTRLLEIYFRQEKIAETEECLLRLRHIVSIGEPPKHLIEHPRASHAAAWLNMYDYWYQARREAEPARRKALGWTALYWYLELGLRLLDNNNIDEFMHFAPGCEIIGELELLGEQQEEFLRHLKRFVMHASVSYCRKMMASPIQLIPFCERNMPGYDEFQALFKKRFISPSPENSNTNEKHGVTPAPDASPKEPHDVNDKHEATPDPAKVQKIIDYLPTVEDPTFSCGRMVDDEPGVFPYPVYTEFTKGFIQDCLSSGLLLMQPTGSGDTIIPHAWDNLTVRLKDQPELFETASLEDLRIFLTMEMQFESFMPLPVFLDFKRGYFVRLLRRLKELTNR